MPTIDVLKEQEVPATPLFLFDCVLSTGAVERWSTHAVTVNGNTYEPRLLRHNLFSLDLGSQDGMDAAQKVSVTLANADSHYSQIERQTGFKGARVTITFLFYDMAAGAAASETRTIFTGIASAPEEITESSLRLSIASRFNLQRIVLPEVRIERQCPWAFPSNSQQRAEALNGGAKGKYSALYRCGYSADQVGGVGNLNGSEPYTSCDYTRASCIARGMFNSDQAGNTTSRFGGIEFVPVQIEVRSFGERGTHLSPLIDNTARYNDFVPLVYGTAWYKPPLVFARNDGNLTHMEVLLGMGEIDSVVKVLVNGVEIPQGRSGADMTATGWFNVVTTGTRAGGFDPDFRDSSGNPLGDPYGSMAMLSVVTPNQINNGQAAPKVEVLANGMKLERFDTGGNSLGEVFTNNPAWVLLDVLRRSGWLLAEIDLASFATAAAYCDELIQTTDLYGNQVAAPRFQCNLVVQDRRSAAEVIKGIRNGSALMLSYGTNGLLRLRVENSIAEQQPTLPEGSNSTAPLNGGWPAYEFSDASANFSGILRRPNGEPAIRLWSRNTVDSPNRLTVEFQDEFNGYQQDSLGLVDFDDSQLTSWEISAPYAALGLPNFDQATRILRLQLNKALRGYTFVELETTVRGVGLSPGDLITVTYLKEGLNRQLFRVVKLAPGLNYETLMITAQWHDDAWYTALAAGAMGGSGAKVDSKLPRPLIGSTIDANGLDQFGIAESVIQGAAGSAVSLTVQFMPPAKPAATAVSAPLLSLSAKVQTTGGTISGNQTLYYALTAVDSNGAESGLSFTVAASIPAGTNTNTVTLTGLRFSQGTASFNVYRGTNPSELLRVAQGVAVAATYQDSGAAPVLAGPPDGNYDHANFYWRRELNPETQADAFSATTIGNSAAGWAADEFKGGTVCITRGTGARQERAIIGNNGTALTVAPAWTLTPDNSSYFTIVDPAWNFGAVGSTSPLQIQLPNWGGQTVQISGRSANAQDRESQYELNPLTRWQIGGDTGIADTDVAPLPAFTLNPTGQGAIELTGITFPTLANTRTISGGSLTLFYWDERNSPSTIALAAAISATDTLITLATASPAQVDDFLQIEGELIQVNSIANGGLQLEVTRGMHESIAAAHPAGAVVYLLERKTSMVSFVPGFFGSPAGGNYTHTLFLPDVRVGAAEFYVINDYGHSPVKHIPYTSTPDGGLRTMSGGQIALQVDGYLAVQTNAAPPFVMDEVVAVKDIFATVRSAPSGGPIQLQVRQNSAVYCTLTIADGATVSNTVSGFGLPPLAAGAQVNLDVVSVPSAANTLPGRDLTVTIRL